MSTTGVTKSPEGSNSLKFVEPVEFARYLVSHEALERADVPEDDLLGLRNQKTGLTLVVRGAGFRQWLRRGH